MNVERQDSAVERIGLLRRFYRAYIAPYPAFAILRHIIIIAYFFGRNFQSKLLCIFFARAYPFLRSRLMVKQSRLPMKSSHMIAAESDLELPGPRSINGFPFGIIFPPKIRVRVPKLEIYEIPNGIILGGSDFLICDRLVGYPDLFELSWHMCPAEAHGAAKINYSKQTIRLSPRYRLKEMKNVCAISLLGQCSGNYVHWLTETLPKLVLVERNAQYAGLPLLVDAGLHKNIYESIRALCKVPRELIYVRRWEPVKLGTIIHVSLPGYTPYEIRPAVMGKGDDHSWYNSSSFSPVALFMMRDAAWAAAKPRAGGQCLYFKRKSMTRKLLNDAAVEELVRAFGFKVIVPEELGFLDQVSILRSAEVIISPVGAALGNLIFANPSCLVIALAGSISSPNYYYFHVLAAILGHDLHYILGPQKANSHYNSMHYDFYADIKTLTATLQNLANTRDVSGRWNIRGASLHNSIAFGQMTQSYGTRADC